MSLTEDEGQGSLSLTSSDLLSVFFFLEDEPEDASESNDLSGKKRGKEKLVFITLSCLETHSTCFPS
jgi:hypothetical protein